MDDPGRVTYLLVDGENIDATLGTSILGRRPLPGERPRWNRILESLEKRWDQPVKGLFFLAVAGEMPASFVQAILAIGYRPIPLQGEGKVVDIAIQRTLAALREREADVVLASHDGDFESEMGDLTDGRRLGLIGFTEFMSGSLRAVSGVEFMDMEYDIEAFNEPLPRVRIIPIDDFDPFEFL